MDNLKQPPHSIEAEQAVIGAVLSFPGCYAEVEFLRADDFFMGDHRTLWSRIRSDESMRDVVTMMTATEDRELMIYIGELGRNTPSAANVKVYARVVKERAMLRRLMTECMSVMSSISNDAKASDVVAGAVRRFQAIGDGAVIGDGPRHVFEIAESWYVDFKERSKNHGMVGLSTGIASLDARWCGLRGGQVVVIAGRPKTGKSTLALNIAEHISRDHPVAVFQMEMSENEMIDRSIASHGRVSISAIRAGTALSDEGGDRMVSAFAALKSSKLYIDATPRQTVDYIRMHCKAFFRRHGKGAIVIDYLGLIRSDGMSRTKNDDIAEISRDIKLLAKETDCPVILLCQMNRNAEKEKRKPQLSDLRDSGAIEQDADIICFTHKDDPEQNYSEIITRAMRSGQPGTDYLLCDFGISRFTQPPEYWEPTQAAKQERSAPKFKKKTGYTP